MLITPTAPLPLVAVIQDPICSSVVPDRLQFKQINVTRGVVQPFLFIIILIKRTLRLRNNIVPRAFPEEGRSPGNKVGSFFSRFMPIVGSTPFYCAAANTGKVLARTEGRGCNCSFKFFYCRECFINTFLWRLFAG